MIKIDNSKLELNDGTYYDLAKTTFKRVMQGLNSQLEEGTLTQQEYNECVTLLNIPHKDLTGKRFGRLTVIRPLKERKYGSIIWDCKCDCGNTKKVSSRNLTEGSTKSCGCLVRESQLRAINSDRIDGTKIGQLKKHYPNSSGMKGVVYSKKHNKWKAGIQIKKKRIHLGYFDRIEDAAKARKEAEEKYFKPIIEEFKKLKN